MYDARAAVTMALGALCFACFVWGTLRHFAREGATPAGTWVISAASLLGFAFFIKEALVTAAAGAPCAMFVASWALWAWAVAYTRKNPPTLAFSGDAPRMLLTGGPYRWLRHPFYGAYLIFWFAAALAAGRPANWLAFLGMALIYAVAARFEERKFARSRFAAAYAAYARNTRLTGRSFLGRPSLGVIRDAVMQLTSVFRLWSIANGVNRWIATGRMVNTCACASMPVTSRFAEIALMGQRWSVLRGFIRDCSLTRLPPAIATRIRAEQVNSLSTLIGVMSLLGLFTVPLILYEFLDSLNSNGLIPLCAFIVGCYVKLMVMSVGWSYGWRGFAGDADRVRRRFVVTCSVLGTSWGVLFISLMGDAHDDRRGLLYAVIIALMSAGVLVAPPSAAFAFWLPVTAAGFFAVTVGSATGDISEVLLLTGYSLLTLFCILYLNRALIRRALGEIEQHEGRETIGLLLRDFEESACDWLWETDARGRLTYVSQRFAQAARLDAERLIGLELLNFLNAHDRAAEPARRITDRPALHSLIERRLPFRDVEVSLQVEADTVWWSLTGKPKFSSRGAFEGYRGVGSDVTQARRANDRARFLAHYDDLTGLANRRLLREVVEGHAQKGRDIALLCLDLDRFKAVNDTFGHPTGDALLIAVSRRLQSHIGRAEICARLGGDEFAVVVETPRIAAVAVLAQMLVLELGRPYLLGEMLVEIGVSIGVSVATPDAASPLGILRAADAALYQAKADGRGTVRFYDRALSERDKRHRALQRDLRDALSRHELTLDYQPIFSLAGGNVSTVEALVRWTRDTEGALSAGDFVPLAESCGLIDDLGEWVLSEACGQAGRLPENVRLAVNVSPLQLHGRRFITHLRRVLAATGLAPERLELELTETAFFDMSEETLGLLQEVRRMGVRINLDDFGVGHTSLGQLRRFPFSTLKIDRSFVQDLPTNASARVIVRGLASMAAEMGIWTTAEGIETEEQLALVRDAGCNDAQGYLLGRPMTLDGVLRLIGTADAAAARTEAPAGAFGHAEMFT